MRREWKKKASLTFPYTYPSAMFYASFSCLDLLWGSLGQRNNKCRVLERRWSCPAISSSRACIPQRHNSGKQSKKEVCTWSFMISYKQCSLVCLEENIGSLHRSCKSQIQLSRRTGGSWSEQKICFPGRGLGELPFYCSGGGDGLRCYCSRLMLSCMAMLFRSVD